MHFKMSSAISFSLDQSKTLLSGNELSVVQMTESFSYRVKNIVGKGVMLVASIFSFFFYFFVRVIRTLDCVLTVQLLQALVFINLQYMSFEITMGKGEIARDKKFLLFPHSVFYPFGELSAIFIKFEIVVCKLFQFGRV